MSNSENGYATSVDYKAHPYTTFNNDAVVITDNAANCNILTTNSMTNGQLVIGSSSGTPQAANLTAGSGITITNGSNSVTIANTSAGAPTTVGAVNTTSIAAAADITSNVLSLHSGSSTNQGVGHIASYQTTAGSIAIGAGAFTNYSTFNTAGGSGSAMTVVGVNAIGSNLTTAQNCTAIGYDALGSTVNGSNNTAVGYQAGNSVSSASNNVFVGNSAGGTFATGVDSIYIGSSAVASTFNVVNEIVIGANTTGSGNNSITVPIGSVPVVANVNMSINPTTGQLTRVSSSERYKSLVEANPPIAQYASYIFQLQPRAYTFNADLDKRVRMGYFAEEVEAIVGPNGNPIFDALLDYSYQMVDDTTQEKDADGKYPQIQQKLVESVHYDGLVLPLIELVRQMSSTITSMQTTITTMQASIAALQK